MSRKYRICGACKMYTDPHDHSLHIATCTLPKRHEGEHQDEEQMKEWSND